MKKILTILAAIFVLAACAEKHFINDSVYRDRVEKRFEVRKNFAANRSAELFSVFNNNLTTEEKEALQFLYAYMPLNDLADYDGEFFLRLVKSSLEAKNTFNWCKNIPEDVFRHFVLPYRVNNENLDSARMVFFRELKDRIKNMTMKEAALEVNHWCHEKVNYKGSDIRTSGPLSTVRTSFGRCGEESTFTVTALRSVGIPARQVYTPRWAHCDDNHAWVEVWIDGKWHYMGACEPEADLDVAWFTEPARRAMMVHTKVFGNYSGKEEILKQTENFTEINVTSNYTETKKIIVKVTDQNNKPAGNVNVEFGLYNYAEFYPIAEKLTDNTGTAFSTSGLGDLLIFASKDNKFAWKKVSVSNEDTVMLKLDDKLSESFVSLDFYPPVEKEKLPVNQNAKSDNDKKLKYEDSIRTSYMNTFIDEKSARSSAAELNLNADEYWHYLDLSEGNWKEIKQFISEVVKSGYNEKIIWSLLGNISEKDLRDTRAEILSDHLSNTSSIKTNSDDELVIKYILSPRIKNENLLSYRKYFKDKFKNLLSLNSEAKVSEIIKEIKTNIKINEEENYYNLPVTPTGVHSLKISNKESRDIYFVAVCRSLEIPARLEETLKIPQYFNGNEWKSINFDDTAAKENPKAFIKLKLQNTGVKIEPLYYIHFTIAKFADGKFTTLEFPEAQKISDFSGKIELDEGYYRLITGNRMTDGSVLTDITHFQLKSGENKEITVSLRKTNEEPKILGTISLGTEVINDNQNTKLSGLINKETIILSWIDPGKEPTRHYFVDLQDLKYNFETWGGNMLFFIPEEKQTESANSIKTKDLPVNVKFVKNKDLAIFTEIKKAIKTEKISFPLVVVITKKGEIIYSSQGYKIGLGEQLLKLIK